jgi:hypothetical protein
MFKVNKQIPKRKLTDFQEEYLQHIIDYRIANDDPNLTRIPVIPVKYVTYSGIILDESMLDMNDYISYITLDVETEYLNFLEEDQYLSKYLDQFKQSLIDNPITYQELIETLRDDLDENQMKVYLTQIQEPNTIVINHWVIIISNEEFVRISNMIYKKSVRDKLNKELKNII